MHTSPANHVTDKHYLRQAINLGYEAIRTHTGGPFGALIVLDNVIIGRGQNAVTSTHDPTAHAEVNAIRHACRHVRTHKLTGATLYTSCEPCPMCLGAIYWARIERVVFAATALDAATIAQFDDHHFYHEIALPWEVRKMPYDQLLHDEGRQLFETWRNKPDKEMY